MLYRLPISCCLDFMPEEGAKKVLSYLMLHLPIVHDNHVVYKSEKQDVNDQFTKKKKKCRRCCQLTLHISFIASSNPLTSYLDKLIFDSSYDELRDTLFLT